MLTVHDWFHIVPKNSRLKLAKLSLIQQEFFSIDFVSLMFWLDSSINNACKCRQKPLKLFAPQYFICIVNSDRISFGIIIPMLTNYFPGLFYLWSLDHINQRYYFSHQLHVPAVYKYYYSPYIFYVIKLDFEWIQISLHALLISFPR